MTHGESGETSAGRRPPVRQRTHSISRALFRILSVGILVPAALVWAVGHMTARTAVTELWDQLADEVAEHTVERTLRFLETGATALEYNAAMFDLDAVDVQDRKAILAYLLAGLEANPNVTWYSLGTTDGAYLSAYRSGGKTRITWREQVEGGALYRDFIVEPDGAWTEQPERTNPYDPRTRAWYQAALAQPGRVWSKPFLFASGPPGFILSRKAVARDGQVVGAWGIEYEMAYISEFLASLEIGTSGRAYLLTKQGEVIGHPKAGGQIDAVQGWIAVRKGTEKEIATVAAHRDPWLRGAAGSLATDAINGRGAFDAGDQTLLWSTRSFPPASGLDWRVTIVVPEQEVLGGIQRNNLLAGLAALIITVFFLILVLWTTRRKVSVPLAGIARDLERMSKLETGVAPSVVQSQITEVANMMDAREAMRSGLRSFKKYVPADLVRELMLRGTEARLGGEQRDLTVMFSDVADFTRISESLDGPQALVGALGEYLDVMSNAILIREGTVDKYIGDAIMAFWGAPKPVDNHPLRACEAAWDSQKALQVLRFRWAKEGLPPFRARIGVNTGSMVVGNIGSTDRMNYTVMGDAVNLASRLEGICKMYGIEIAVGPSTWREVEDHFVGRPVDCVAVKGKTEAVTFYELLGPKNDTSPADLELAQVYAEAFEQYRARDFETARAGFQRSLALRPGDLPAQTLIERCEAYLREPPPEAWSGAVQLTRK